jgi:predicted transcriptional regulator
MAMTLRLTHEEDERLTELAEAEGRSKHEIMRLALADRWAKLHKEQQLSEILGRVLPRYRRLLERIGTA